MTGNAAPTNKLHVWNAKKLTISRAPYTESLANLITGSPCCYPISQRSANFLTWWP